MTSRPINEDDLRAAGALSRADVTPQFLELRGMITTDVLTEELLTEKGAALESEVIKKDDDPGDLVLIIENKLV